jgi:putative transposase
MVYVNSTETVNQPERDDDGQNKKRTLNNSIAIMLRSYAEIINKEQGRVGSLFRQKTKAVCLDPADGFIPTWYTIAGLTKVNYQFPESQYPQVCFNYIHNNPVTSGLVKDIYSWEFSSATEILGLEESKLVNRQKVKEFGFKLIRNEPVF